MATQLPFQQPVEVHRFVQHDTIELHTNAQHCVLAHELRRA